MLSYNILKIIYEISGQQCLVMWKKGKGRAAGRGRKKDKIERGRGGFERGWGGIE